MRRLFAMIAVLAGSATLLAAAAAPKEVNDESTRAALVKIPGKDWSSRIHSNI
jgi:hypothetical protein